MAFPCKTKHNIKHWILEMCMEELKIHEMFWIFCLNIEYYGFKEVVTFWNVDNTFPSEAC